MRFFRVVVLKALMACALLAAQGEIRLHVSDASGTPVQASGTIHSDSGASRSFQTDTRGDAVLDALPYGRYRIELAKPGFASRTLLVHVEPSAPRTHKVTLAISSPSFVVEVVSAAPLAGSDIPENEMPAPVQRVTAEDLERSGAVSVPELLNRRMNGVFANELQGNPVQPDISYRGYTVSPLLGTPQGLSLYADGVRLNQPFGDVVSWDLIPRSAIGEVTVMPGSNPLFGLNTLGGALVISTKDGRSHPGAEVTLSGGSFGRKIADVEYGGARRGLHYYGGTNLTFEDGWRESSPSNVRQFFGSVGWQRANSSITFAGWWANNLLNGNGLQEIGLLGRSWSSVYTKPDITYHRSPFGNVRVRHGISSNVRLDGNVYYRYIRTRTWNGDINEESLDQAIYQPNAAERAALAAAGFSGFPASGESAVNTPFPKWRCLANALRRDEPDEKCNAAINQTFGLERDYGASGQLTWRAALGTRGRNQLTGGMAVDRSSSHFGQLSELGYLNPDRSVTGVGAFGDPVSLLGRRTTVGVYATDTLSVGRRLSFTASGRYNRTAIDNRDRIVPTGAGSLTGRHTFARFNPSVGLTFTPVAAVNAFFSYSEGSRAPTSVELGCADPEIPCRLPNAMQGDPPLNQVVVRSAEAGIRGGMESPVRWSLSWFRAANRDDILFVSSPQTGFGYFRNFGRTVRQGVQIDAGARLPFVLLGGGYTFLAATFESPESVNGSANSTNAEALAGSPGRESSIDILPGNRIPLIPRHLLKAYADVPVTDKLELNATLYAAGSSFARGNENNLHQPDGIHYLGPGRSPGYAVVNAGARYRWSEAVSLFAQVMNVLDRRYYTGAQLGPLGITPEGTFVARPLPAVGGEYPVRQSTFLAPGAPLSAFGGLRFRF